MRNEAQELCQYFMIITITPTPQHGVVVANLTLHSHLQFFTTHYLGTYGIFVTSALLQSCGKGKFLAGYLESYEVPVLASSNKFKSANMSCM